MKLLLSVVVNVAALGAATWLLSGITVTADSTGQRVVTMVLVAVVFGLVNAVVRPVVKFFTFPLILLTLGLLVFVINALMLLLTSWVSGQVGLDFHVNGFWTALLGALVITVATWLLELLLPEER